MEQIGNFQRSFIKAQLQDRLKLVLSFILCKRQVESIEAISTHF